MKIQDVVKKLDATLLILVTLVSLAAVATFWKGGLQMTISGFVQAVRLLDTIWLRLILGFTLGGLIQVLIPREIIAWSAPLKGIQLRC